MMCRAAREAGRTEEEICKIQDDHPEGEGEEGKVFRGKEEEVASQGIEARRVGFELVDEQRGLEHLEACLSDKQSTIELHPCTIVHNFIRQFRNLRVITRHSNGYCRDSADHSANADEEVS